MQTDACFMRRALALAEQGRGQVEPNPMVGAVVVRDGKIVGEGWHQRYGGSHAEVHALAAAGDAARESTLYVTLEPCCHQGKTPPCTQAIVRAGIRRVVAAMNDPFAQVAGKGIAELRQAGIGVDVGMLEPEARRLNAAYLKLVRTGRPWVHAKWAMTLDGKIATASGDSRWISGEASRAWVHWLRGMVDAILVGAGTARRDDPQLTARPAGPRVATRIVLTQSGDLSPELAVVRTAREVPTIIACPKPVSNALLSAGCEAVLLPAEGGLAALLDELGRRRMTHLLIEGGSQTLGSFFDAGLIDELHVFIAPLILGGKGSLTPVAGADRPSIAQALGLAEWRHERVGDDLVCHGVSAAKGDGMD